MEKGKKLIQDLSREEAFFFKNSPDTSTDSKGIWLTKELDILASEIDHLGVNEHESKYLKGCTFNIGNVYNPRAEESLIDAAKMNPTMYEIWNELGDCIWKKGDKKGAKNCFERALSQQKNKVSLRNISIVMRQQDGVTKEQIEESVKISKEAVSLDVSDGTSWYILGNAYLAKFFLNAQASNILKCSLSAYEKASKDEKVLGDPDFYYNKGIVMKYLDLYADAMTFFKEALVIHPEFAECHKELSDLKKQLQMTSSLIQNKGKLKAKNIALMLRKLKEKTLGLNTTLTVINDFTQLGNGKNDGKALNCILISSVVPNGRTPFVCICLDAEANCFALNLYNIEASKAPKLADVITIPTPHKTDVILDMDNNCQIQFSLIRVEAPMNLLLNNRQLTRDVLAPLRLTTTALT